MHIDEALKTHLPKQYAEIFTNAVEDRAVFLDGVNYEHEGKVWNVRVAMNEDKGLFIRFHHEGSVSGEYWESLPKGLSEKSVSQYSKERATTGSSSYLPEAKEGLSPDSTYQVINKDHATDKATPKVLFKIDNSVIDFFKTCPQLTPEFIDLTPLPTSISREPTKKDSNLFNKVLLIFLGVVAAYVMYRVATLAVSYWQESKA
ncbi:hypothetical protein [Simkania sp.]|uniref:hypothetical protein n=1 Tax=Simkania sp. TaxID=34094 RepID=UPI003B51F0FE